MRAEVVSGFPPDPELVRFAAKLQDLADSLMPDPGCRAQRLVLKKSRGVACFGKVEERP